MSGRLSQTVVVGGVVYPAGSTVPADVAKGITAKGVWAGSAPADDEPVGYDAQKVADLEAEIANRNEGRDEADQIVPAGTKKADLIAALEADDKKA